MSAASRRSGRRGAVRPAILRGGAGFHHFRGGSDAVLPRGDDFRQGHPIDGPESLAKSAALCDELGFTPKLIAPGIVGQVALPGHPTPDAATLPSHLRVAMPVAPPLPDRPPRTDGCRLWRPWPTWACSSPSFWSASPTFGGRVIWIGSGHRAERRRRGPLEGHTALMDIQGIFQQLTTRFGPAVSLGRRKPSILGSRSPRLRCRRFAVFCATSPNCDSTCCTASPASTTSSRTRRRRPRSTGSRTSR